CHGTKISRVAASSVGERRSIRTLTKQQPDCDASSSSLKHSRKGKTKPKTPSSGDCVNRLAQLPFLRMELQVDKQVAASAETRTPNLHRAKNRSSKSADGRVADSGSSAGKKTLSNEKTKE